LSFEKVSANFERDVSKRKNISITLKIINMDWTGGENLLQVKTGGDTDER
jgi:hypothetical protein